MSDSIRVHFFTLTDTHASEHVYMASLREALREHGIEPVDDWREADVVHLFEVNFYSRAALSEFEYPRLFRILRSDTPVVASTDDLYFLDRPELTVRPKLYSLNHYTQRWLFEQCDAVIAISESVQNALTQYLDPGKVHVVKHGVDDRYRSDADSEDPPFVLHVSLAAPRKNPATIREVAQRLDSRFVIAGGGWGEEFRDVPNVENVELRGYVPEDELIDLYKRASVFYFPTLHEGFGLPILEAMAAGCAVVTSDVYSIPEIAGDAAILCDPHDVDSHVAEIERLIANANARKRLANEANERARQFTWDEAAERTIDLYHSLI